MNNRRRIGACLITFALLLVMVCGANAATTSEGDLGVQFEEETADY